MTIASLAAVLLVSAFAQEMDHAHMHHEGMDMGEDAAPMVMTTREGSGTSWQPASTPHEGLHETLGAWTVMAHGFAQGVFDRQGGPRGKDKGFSASMLMGMASRPLGDGTLSLRAMLSLDPAMGAGGYPLLLQTGETADGRNHLIDQQHPHDLFGELSAKYEHGLGGDLSGFFYFGLPGEPALGPVMFLHRASGEEIPEAPITHHWLDSTHISFGAATLGLVWKDWKLEGSTFRGREPDRHRWDIEGPKLDSYSTRLSYNPTADWALQVSYGRIVSPEELEPDVDTKRLTASASYNYGVGPAKGQATLAFGQNRNEPGRRLDAWLLESSAKIGAHTVFTRLERAEKDELFDDADPLAGEPFAVGKASLGWLYDFAKWKRTQWGAGVLGSVYALPKALHPAYGASPFSFMLFARVKLI